MKNVSWIMDVMEDLMHFTEQTGLTESSEALQKTAAVIESELHDMEFRSKIREIRNKRKRSRMIRHASHLTLISSNENPI